MSVTLEIMLRRGYRVAYEADLRLSRSDDVGESRYLGVLAPDFDPDGLPPVGDGRAYGERLGAALLYHERVREGVDEATALAGAEPLRVRLYVHPDAARLYGIAWETARDPRPDRGGALLFAGDRRVFSRFVTSGDIRALYRRPPGTLRILVAVASPKDIGEYEVRGVRLPPVEEAAEVERVRGATAGAAHTSVLRSSERPVTHDGLLAALEDDYDVLYLCCHGALDRQGTPVLYLDDESGAADPVSGDAFVERVAALRDRPRLVVLASCQSAGASPDDSPVYGAGGALAPLGPRLAEAGVAAVVAMQGDVSVAMVNDFVPELLRQVARHGTVDRAVSQARARVAAAHRDWWAPALITRLRTGEIFRRTSFAGPAGGFEQHWESVITAIANGKCLPILGPALLERHIGTRRELAVRLAQHFKRPVPRGEHDLLALVAQQVATTKPRDDIQRRLLVLIAEMVAERYRGVAPPELLAPLAAAATSPLVLKRLRAVLDFATERAGPTEPHRLLARLEIPLYVTANADDALARWIVRERGAAPVSEVHRWREEHRFSEDDPESPPPVPSVWDREPEYRPTVERPLVFHFFGSAEYQDSLAVTQDDYVDALVAASRPQDQTVHRIVRSALTRSTLMLLGFQLSDWSFRSLFRFIMNQEGRGLLKDKVHVAVQVDPDDGGFDDPDAAAHFVKQYLGAYFDRERLGVYWGTVEDFMCELYRQRGEDATAAPVRAPAAGPIAAVPGPAPVPAGGD